jgi:hypothetical protein
VVGVEPTTAAGDCIIHNCVTQCKAHATVEYAKYEGVQRHRRLTERAKNVSQLYRRIDRRLAL